MLRVIFRLFQYAPQNLLPSPDDREEWRRTRLNMIRAILERDADYAQILSRRFASHMQKALEAAAARGDPVEPKA
jgi:hypothetical protein